MTWETLTGDETMLDTMTLLCGRHAPHLTVRLVAVAANSCRRAGAEQAARWLAAWAYDVCDFTMAAEPAFSTHRRLMPWAWNSDRTLLAWWGGRA